MATRLRLKLEVTVEAEKAENAREIADAVVAEVNGMPGCKVTKAELRIPQHTVALETGS